MATTPPARSRSAGTAATRPARAWLPASTTPGSSPRRVRSRGGSRWCSRRSPGTPRVGRPGARRETFDPRKSWVIRSLAVAAHPVRRSHCAVSQGTRRGPGAPGGAAGRSRPSAARCDESHEPDLPAHARRRGPLRFGASMLVILKPGTPEAGAAGIITRLRMAGLAVHRTEHDGRTRVAAVGDTSAVDWKEVERWPGVESVGRLARPFKLASRAFRPHDTVISVGKVAIGSQQLAIMAGPCSVEGEEQVFTIARAVAQAGATVLRGGAYKPRTSPYAFQGLGEEGLKLLRRAADANGLAVVS